MIHVNHETFLVLFNLLRGPDKTRSGLPRAHGCAKCIPDVAQALIGTFVKLQRLPP